MKSFSFLYPLLGLAACACSSDTSDSNGNSSGSGAAAGSGGSGGGDTGGDGGSGGTEASTGLETISNVPVEDIDYNGVPGITFHGNTSINTSTGIVDGMDADEGGFQYFALDQADGGPRVGVFVFRNVVIDASAVIEVVGAIPLVLVARDNIDIYGQIVAAVDNDDAAGGGFSCTPSGEGGGPGGGSATTGGGGSFCGVGADRGGSQYGNAELVPLMGGSSGGCQGSDDAGGAGGGAIQLVAGVQITVGVGAAVSVGGGGGAYAAGDDRSGGGSGGAILLEAPKVTMAGTLAANGGAGNDGCGGLHGDCDNATNGLSSARPAEGREGAGNGSAADTIDGEAGLGGGGGAGRIRINSDPEQTTISGVISPSVSTECFSQGALGE